MTARAAWAQTTFDSFDFETTGVNVEQDRAVTASILAMDPVRRDLERQEWLIDPGVAIPEGATKVHGITTEHAVANGMPPREALQQIRDRLTMCWDLGRALVVYNAPYDLTLLDRELRRHGLDPLKVLGPVVDPLVLDKKINLRVRGKGARRLMNTCARNGITLTEEEAHTSSGDALAAGRLAYVQAASPLISHLSGEALHRKQVDWFEAQSISFASWLATQPQPNDAEQVRKNAKIGWPMLPFVDEFAHQPDEAPF